MRLRYRMCVVLLLLALTLTWGVDAAQAEGGPVLRIAYFYATDFMRTSYKQV